MCKKYKWKPNEYGIFDHVYGAKITLKFREIFVVVTIRTSRDHGMIIIDKIRNYNSIQITTENLTNKASICCRRGEGNLTMEQQVGSVSSKHCSDSDSDGRTRRLKKCTNSESTIPSDP